MAGKSYIAGRPLTVGGEEVKEYAEGDEVHGADGFENLDALVAGGFLVEKASKLKAKAEPEAAEAPAPKPRKRSSAKRTSSRPAAGE